LRAPSQDLASQYDSSRYNKSPSLKNVRFGDSDWDQQFSKRIKI